MSCCHGNKRPAPSPARDVFIFYAKTCFRGNHQDEVKVSQWLPWQQHTCSNSQPTSPVRTCCNVSYFPVSRPRAWIMSTIHGRVRPTINIYSQRFNSICTELQERKLAYENFMLCKTNPFPKM